ncbi:MAG: DUF1673 domain-containing protein [Odoribacteraceae bacterium]|jgi:hypothetical protein|nr:DUF1673 domain-containing protein [Odoribacteraceae bacterium]
MKKLDALYLALVISLCIFGLIAFMMYETGTSFEEFDAEYKAVYFLPQIFGKHVIMRPVHSLIALSLLAGFILAGLCYFFVNLNNWMARFTCKKTGHIHGPECVCRRCDEQDHACDSEGVCKRCRKRDTGKKNVTASLVISGKMGINETNVIVGGLLLLFIIGGAVLFAWARSMSSLNTVDVVISLLVSLSGGCIAVFLILNKKMDINETNVVARILLLLFITGVTVLYAWLRSMSSMNTADVMLNVLVSLLGGGILACLWTLLIRFLVILYICIVGLACKKFGHKYGDECVCRRCGKIEHDWDGCVCRECGETDMALPDAIHDWDGCVCRKCGKKDRDKPADVHDWDGCVCRKCGKKDYYKPYEAHDWERCICRKCGKIEHHGNGCDCPCGCISHDYQLAEQWWNGTQTYRCSRCGDEITKG